MATKKAPTKKAPANKVTRKPAHEKGLLCVRSGRILQWPNGTKRGGAGTVVREDDPYISDYRSTLVAAPKGSKVTEVTDRAWLRAARALGFDFTKGFDKEAAAKLEAEEAEAAQVEKGLEPVAPDELPDAEA